jgi:oxygen-independent coproporphyrinogen-3 oxidase
VSNFARPGFESRHNLLYWRSESYLGAGAGAVGCLHAGAGEGGPALAALRWTNHRDVGAWLAAVESGALPTAEEDRLGPVEVRNERLMLALRTAGGIETAGLSPAQSAEAGRLVRAGLAQVRRGRLALTPRGLDVHSAVAERMFE